MSIIKNRAAGFPTVTAVSRYMYRHGHPDLARWFEADRRKRERP